MKKILILLSLLLLTSCWIDLDKGSEDTNSETGIDYLGGEEERDSDGDLIRDELEILIGTNPQVPEIPSISPSNVKTSFRITTDQNDSYNIFSESRSMENELLKRLSANILENYYLIDSNRDYEISPWLFRSASLLNMSLKDRMVLRRHIEKGHRVDGSIEFSIDLAISGFSQLQNYQNIVASINVLDRVTGEFTEITSFSLKSARGGELMIENYERDKFQININTSIPVLYIPEEDLLEIISDRKELVFSIKSFNYQLAGSLYLESDTFENILSKNTNFFFVSDKKVERKFLPLGINVGAAISFLGKELKTSVLGEILSIDDVISTNVSTINPSLLKESEYERTNWYGLHNKNNVNDKIEARTESGVLNISNIDLAKGMNKSFTSITEHTNDYNFKVIKNDISLFKIQLFKKYPKLTSHDYVVRGRYKREVCTCRPSRGDVREFIVSGQLKSCDGVLTCRMETGDTNCRAKYIEYHGIMNDLKSFDADLLNFLTVKLGEEKIPVPDLIKSGRAYLSDDRETLYIEVDNKDKMNSNFRVYTEPMKDRSFTHGHHSYYGACDIDHGVQGYKPQVSVRLKNAEYYMVSVESETYGINRVASDK